MTHPFQLLFIAFSLLGLPAHALAQNVPQAPPPPRTSRYLTSQNLNFAALLPQPPAPGTTAAMADSAAVHSAESSRTPAQIRNAQRDDHEESIFLFATILGPHFNAADLPLTAAFSTHLRAESGVINPALKVAFQRPRPFLADPSVQAVCDRAPTNSYPSGHAMVGYLEAFALAQMIPERSEAILARAGDYAHNRIVCGVHYPTDIEASHTAALALFGELSTSPRFQQELTAVGVELRSHLRLNPEKQDPR